MHRVSNLDVHWTPMSTILSFLALRRTIIVELCQPSDIACRYRHLVFVVVASHEDLTVVRSSSNWPFLPGLVSGVPLAIVYHDTVEIELVRELIILDSVLQRVVFITIASDIVQSSREVGSRIFGKIATELACR